MEADVVKKPWSNLNEMITLIRTFQEKDMDLIIPVTGIKGCGKSTLTIEAARRYVKKYLKTGFYLEKYIAYDNDDVMHKINNLPEYSPLICDEAVRFVMGEDWNKSESKDMKKLFTQIRTKHLVIFLSIPNFFWIDRKYREEMCMFWIHIMQRGQGLIFTKDLRIGVDDSWHKDYFGRIKTPINIFSKMNVIMKKYRRHPCYYNDISFPQTPKDIYARYKELRDKQVFNATPKHTVQLAKLIFYNLERYNKFTLRQAAELTRDPFNNDKKTYSLNAINKWVLEIKSNVKKIKDIVNNPKGETPKNMVFKSKRGRGTEKEETHL